MGETIKINWFGPFSPEEIINNNIQENGINGTDKGLYQIYGSHPLYGEGILVYIGRTKQKNNFAKRLKNRWEYESDKNRYNVTIYLGKIFDDQVKLSDSALDQKIDKAEVLLINTLKPAYNSSNIKSVKNDLLNEDYSIYNYGNYRSIYPILDSKYFWQELKNYRIVEKLSELYEVKVEYEDDYCGFALPENDNIFAGIDYGYWDEENVPLTIALSKEAYNGYKKDIKEKFGNLYEDDEYYYLPAHDNLKDDVEDIMNNIKENIDDLKAFLDSLNK